MHSIDQAFYGLSSLQVLALDNQFTGFMPNRIWKTNPQLTQAFLNENMFSGPLPSEIGEAKNLLAFSFYNNHISGTVPSTLGLLSSLGEFGILF